MTHKKMRPHTATDNAEIERCQRTLGEPIAGRKLEDFAPARAVIAGIVAE